LYEIEKVTSYLDRMFKVRDLGNLKYFLGIEVVRSQKSIHICKKKGMLLTSLLTPIYLFIQ